MSNQAASDLARLAPTGITVPAAFWSDLESAYDSPRARAYHSIERARSPR